MIGVANNPINILAKEVEDEIHLAWTEREMYKFTKPDPGLALEVKKRYILGYTKPDTPLEEVVFLMAGYESKLGEELSQAKARAPLRRMKVKPETH